MTACNIIWLPVVRDKLLEFRGFRFTDEETHDFIAQLILEIEDQLTSSFLIKTYTEEYGRYKGISRIVIKKFKIYYERYENDIIILAITFPGEK